MSSGALLLQQLRQRQHRPSPPAASSPQATATSQPESTRIVICTGVDCSGLGGGAALIEIEELCAELEFEGGASVSVASGVCTLQCANAPVVNVQGHGFKRTSAGLAIACGVRHHARVDSAAECRKVVDDAAGRVGPAAPDGDVMQRRADGLRFAALKQLDRRLRQQRLRPPQLHNPGSQLAMALQAEANAAKTPARRARAERRAARLTRSL